MGSIEYYFGLYVASFIMWSFLMVFLFNLVKKENYPNTMEYEKAVDKLVNSIRLINSDVKTEDFRDEASNVKIEIVHYNIEQWQEFLNFLEMQTNRRVDLPIIKKVSC